MKIAYVLTQPDQIGGPLTYNKHLITVLKNQTEVGYTFYVPEWAVENSYIPVDGTVVKSLGYDNLAELEEFDIVHFTSHLGANDVAEYKNKNVAEPKWLTLLKQINNKVVVTVHDRTAMCETSWSKYLQENCVLHAPNVVGVVYWRKGFYEDIQEVIPRAKELPFILQKPFLPEVDHDVPSYSSRELNACYFGRPVTNKGMSRVQRALPVIKDAGYKFNAYVSYNIFWMDIKKFESDAGYALIDNIVKNYTAEEVTKYMCDNRLIFNPGWSNSSNDEGAIPEWATIEAIMSGCVPVLSENYGKWLTKHGLYCISHEHHPSYPKYVEIVTDIMKNLPTDEEMDKLTAENVRIGKELFSGQAMLDTYVDFYKTLV